MDDLGVANSRLMRAIDVLRNKLDASHGPVASGVESAVMELETSSLQAKDAFRRQVFELEHTVLQLRSSLEVKAQEAEMQSRVNQDLKGTIHRLSIENERLQDQLKDSSKRQQALDEELSRSIRNSEVALKHGREDLEKSQQVTKAVESKLLGEIQTAYTEIESLKSTLVNTKRELKQSENGRLFAVKQLESARRKLQTLGREATDAVKPGDVLLEQLKTTNEKVCAISDQIGTLNLEDRITNIMQSQFDRLLQGARESADGTVIRVSEVVAATLNKKKHKMDDNLKRLGDKLETVNSNLNVIAERVDDGFESIGDQMNSTQQQVQNSVQLCLGVKEVVDGTTEKVNQLDQSMRDAFNSTVSEICGSMEQLIHKLSNGQDDSQLLSNIKANLSKLDKENHILEQENEALTTQTKTLKQEICRLQLEIRQVPEIQRESETLQTQLQSKQVQLEEKSRQISALTDKVDRYRSRLVQYAQEEQRSNQQRKWEKIKEKEDLKRDRMQLERKMSGILRDIANQQHSPSPAAILSLSGSEDDDDSEGASSIDVDVREVLGDLDFIDEQATNAPQTSPSSPQLNLKV